MYTLGGGVNEAQGWGRVGRDARRPAGARRVRRRSRSGSASATATSAPTSPAASGWARASRCREVTARLAARWGLPDQRRDAAADDRHPGRDPRGRRRGRRAGRGRCTSRSGGCGCGPRCRRSGSSRSAWTGRRPPPASWTRSATPTSILLPPSNPVVSIGIILGVPGVRDALRGSRAPGRRGVAADRGRARCAGTPTPACPRSGSPRPPGRWPGCTTTSWTAGWSTSPTRSWPTRRGGSGRGPAAVMHDVPSAADIAGAALDLAAGLRDDAV